LGGLVKKPSIANPNLTRATEAGKKGEAKPRPYEQEPDRRRNAKGLANQGNRYAKIAKSGTFAPFVSDSLLELGGLTNPLTYYLKRREALC